MSDTVDLRELLSAWPYDADENVRLDHGSDGREIMQVRLPLGIEQFEIDGRPDGLRSHGYESAFDYQLSRQSASNEVFFMSSGDCSEVFAESMLYYYRYVNLFKLKDWARTIRDTERNLKLFDFVHRHAQNVEDQVYLEQWRPYVMRMCACARAMGELESGQFDAALKIIGEASIEIQTLPENEETVYAFERERSLTALKTLARQIEKSKPVSKLDQLEKQLRKAIAIQEFEKAAVLRDQIRALRRVASPNPADNEPSAQD
jgi:hypothetical protein